MANCRTPTPCLPRYGNRNLEILKGRIERLSTPEPNTGCVIWLGRIHRGYGIMNIIRNTAVRVHRLSYEMHKGKIPDGLVLDHLCHVKSCINPDHLEPVTQAENLRRARTEKRAFQ